MKVWIVKTASVCSQGDGFAITGTNLDASVETDREFSWNIGHYSIEDSRYDFSGAVWGEGAKDRYAQLVRLSQRGRGVPV